MRASEAARHTALDRLQSRDGQLLIGGETVGAILARVGRTPFYAYDRQAITTRVAQLRAALPADMHLHYAIKANPMPELVAHMAGLVDGFDVASAGELRVALAAGMAPERISFAGPGKAAAELEAAVAAGITVHVESEREIAILHQIGGRGTRPRLAIRVNPAFQLKTAGMKMGGGASQFGIDAERVPAILRSLDIGRVEFRGFHIFAGSQNLSAAAISEAQLQAVALAEELAADAPAPVAELNIGGGLGIPYFPGEQPVDLAAIGSSLAQLVVRARGSLPGTRLIMELGRYLVGEAGYYVCRVVDRKESRGRIFLVTDGGLHHHLSASGNFGQVIRKNYPVVIASRMGQPAGETASVVGPLCTPLDLLADGMRFPPAGPGDLVAVLQSGAYGFTASPLGFLSHPEPLEILV
ncbi:diaminopimelate decarboxylase [Gammaproteobacteria bacterium]|nr:pyridoxal-dependent decarboxylase, exosortase A system-associated [Gammaproteobacteria bacterium]CAG0939158.1 diaminopimelate decarboxylase [Gammaproteobacteria bacterium]